MPAGSGVLLLMLVSIVGTVVLLALILQEDDTDGPVSWSAAEQQARNDTSSTGQAGSAASGESVDHEHEHADDSERWGVRTEDDGGERSGWDR